MTWESAAGFESPDAVDTIAIAARHFYLPMALLTSQGEPSGAFMVGLAMMWRAGVHALRVGGRAPSEGIDVTGADSPRLELSGLLAQHGLIAAVEGGEALRLDRDAVSRAFAMEALMARWVTAFWAAESEMPIEDLQSYATCLAGIEAVHSYLWTGSDTPDGHTREAEESVLAIHKEIRGRETFQFSQVLEVLHLTLCRAAVGGSTVVPLDWLLAKLPTLPAVEGGAGLPEDLVRELSLLPNAAQFPSGTLRAIRAVHWLEAIEGAIAWSASQPVERVKDIVTGTVAEPIDWDPEALRTLTEAFGGNARAMEALNELRL